MSKTRKSGYALLVQQFTKDVRRNYPDWPAEEQDYLIHDLAHERDVLRAHQKAALRKGGYARLLAKSRPKA